MPINLDRAEQIGEEHKTLRCPESKRNRQKRHPDFVRLSRLFLDFCRSISCRIRDNPARDIDRMSLHREQAQLPQDPHTGQSVAL